MIFQSQREKHDGRGMSEADELRRRRRPLLVLVEMPLTATAGKWSSAGRS